MTPTDTDAAREAAVDAAKKEAAHWKRRDFNNGPHTVIVMEPKIDLDLERPSEDHVTSYRFYDDVVANHWLNRRCIDAAIDAFLAKSLEGADEEIKTAGDRWHTASLNPERYAAWVDAHAHEDMHTLLTLVTAMSAKNAALSKKVSELVTLLDQQLGTPCEQIRHQQEVENLQRELTAARNALEEERERCAKACYQVVGKYRALAKGAREKELDLSEDYYAARASAAEDCAEMVLRLPSPQVKK